MAACYAVKSSAVMNSLVRQGVYSNSRTALQTRTFRECQQLTGKLADYSRPYTEVGIRSAVDHRSRLSGIWIPTDQTQTTEQSSHAKLIRAGFLRQAHSGIFHILPLGLRVQNKLEALIDKYMLKLGASKVSLSSVSSEKLWAKSGRLTSAGSEIFRFKDRKGARYLLSPTHEEEITELVSSNTKSYRELPIRLYQISRKYRDELRPRQGLLRSREFIMKDLYTFDYSSDLALKTYHDVRNIYAKLFDELKIPYLTAEADSGDIGGDLSHEFHFPTPNGEDNIISCIKCDYVANEELTESTVPDNISVETSDEVKVWSGITHDRKTLVNVWYTPQSISHQTGINTHAVKSVVPGLDASIEDPLSHWKQLESNSQIPQEVGKISDHRQILSLIDYRVSNKVRAVIESNDHADSNLNKEVKETFVIRDPSTGLRLNLMNVQDGDPCKHCLDGTLKVQKAIELGHTFHLGTRYSDPLEATISVPTALVRENSTAESSLDEIQTSPDDQKTVAFQMGCHGIGVSRIIGAVADNLADDIGLNWPRVMAPFEAIIVPVSQFDDVAIEVYDVLSASSPVPGSSNLDLVLDDRPNRFGWKMKDADRTGYPIIVVAGGKWTEERKCEVQCRRLGIRQDVPSHQLLEFIQSLLSQL